MPPPKLEQKCSRVAIAAAAVVGVYVLRRLMKKSKKKATPAVVLREALESELVGGPPPGGKAYTSCADGELLRGVSREGAASWETETVPFLIERLQDNKTLALGWESEDDLASSSSTPKYRTWTWVEYIEQIQRAAASMVLLGLKARQSCAILGFNSKEWLVADLASILAGGFATGIYATNGVESVRYILEHSKAAIVVVEGPKQAAKVEAALEKNAFDVKAIVAYGPEKKYGDGDNTAESLPFRRLLWDDFMAMESDGATAKDVKEKAAEQRPGQACTLIYTSGTTGAPKAVAVSHDNITWVVRSFASTVGFGQTTDERLVSYLPLSHIAAQAIDIYANLCLVGRSVTEDQREVGAATVYFARPDALKGSLKLTLCAVRPTVFFGVPRVFEKFAEALQAVGAKTTGTKKKISTWAKKVALAKYNRGRADYVAPAAGFEGILAILSRAVQEKLAMAVLKKVHAAIGLDHCHFCFTGAAPISVATLEYFGSLGLNVNEAFGMSEVSGPASVTFDDYYVPGTTGPACPGVEIKLEHVAGRDKDDEGEVCFRGRSVMLGYLRNEEKTKETIDEDGWLHSGDTGRLVVVKPGANPMLKITGRIKELLITAGGENVAPVPIEDAIKNLLPCVSNAVVVGDKLKFLAVLLTLKQQAKDDGTFEDVLVGPAAAVDKDVDTAAKAAQSSVFQDLVQSAIDSYNKEIAVSAAQKLQKFAILPMDFSQSTGELTPTLKLKRAAVVEKYSHVLTKLYGTNASAVWS